MKLFTTVFCLALFATFGYAQDDMYRIAGYEFFNQYRYQYNENQKEKEQLSKKNVRERVSIYHMENGKTSKTIEQFDTQGNLVQHQYFDSKNRLYAEYHYTYDTEDRLVFSSQRYDKKRTTTEYKYDRHGKICSTIDRSEKGDYFGRIDERGDHGKIISTTLYKKDSVNAYKRLEYDYYEDQSVKSIRYFEKGKLKYTWAYDCKPEGELVGVKTEDTTRICVKEEYDPQGNRVVWRQEFNKKGELEKVKMVYDRDSTLLAYVKYDQLDQLRNRTTFFKDGGQFSESFDKKGNLTYTYESIYNGNQQILKKKSVGRRWSYTDWYSYSNELLATHTYLGRKSTRVTEYTYAFYE